MPTTALTSAAGPPPAPPPPSCGSRPSRRRAHHRLHSPGARPEAAPGQGRGGWGQPQQHRPWPGRGSPSQHAPGSAACRPPGLAPACPPPASSHSGCPSPRWVKSLWLCLSGAPVLTPDRVPDTELGFGEQLAAACARRWPAGGHRSPPCPSGALSPSATHPAAVYGRQHWEDRPAEDLSFCPSLCPAVCPSLHGSGRRDGLPKKVCSPVLGWVAPAASRSSG